jgi:ABC-type bacteriocin/lantibiotic exporter with double-glycine peptidase domain
VGCLSVVSRLHGRPVSATALEAGLPRTQEGMTPYAVIRAARREGIDAQITHKPVIDKISPLNMPCILLMQDGSACVLVSLKDGEARIIVPENPTRPSTPRLKSSRKPTPATPSSLAPRPAWTTGPRASRSSTPRSGSGAPSCTFCPFTGT